MTKSISKNIKTRLLAQAEEASVNNLVKLANTVQAQVIESSVRNSDASYVYSSAEMQADVQDLLWKAALRVQDYFEKTADIEDLESEIEKTAEDFIDSVKRSLGKVGLVGPFEPKLPGEK